MCLRIKYQNVCFYIYIALKIFSRYISLFEKQMHLVQIGRNLYTDKDKKLGVYEELLWVSVHKGAVILL